MKKIFKTLGICFIACLAFNCTSDDNSTGNHKPGEEKPGEEKPGEKTLVVLDRLEHTEYSTSYENGELTETELFSQSTYLFSYDEQGRVTMIETTELDEIPFDGGYLNHAKSIVTYNDANQIIRLHTLDLDDNEDWYDETFEYNSQGLLTKSFEATEGELKTYGYNAQNQISTITNSLDNTQHTINYEYDRNGNIIRAYDPSNNRVQELFTYDDKLTPYTHMNISLLYDDYESTYPLTLSKMGKNNVVTYKDYEGVEWVTEYEFNSTGYPIKAISYYKNNKELLGYSKVYTYKTITIKNK